MESLARLPQGHLVSFDLLLSVSHSSTLSFLGGKMPMFRCWIHFTRLSHFIHLLFTVCYEDVVACTLWNKISYSILWLRHREPTPQDGLYESEKVDGITETHRLTVISALKQSTDCDMFKKRIIKKKRMASQSCFQSLVSEKACGWFMQSCAAVTLLSLHWRINCRVSWSPLPLSSALGLLSGSAYT